MPLDFIPRPYLIYILEKHHGIPLCLVLAPAGYGKSTTVSSWLEQCGHRTAWLSLDEEDNEIVVFVNYFIAAIHNSYPNFRENISKLVNARETPPVKTIAYQLIIEFVEIEEDLIIGEMP